MMDGGILPMIQQEKKGPIRKGRRKINIEYIPDKTRRHVTFSKRKAGIMKKAYELATLTGTQVLLLVASETGHVYTFATPKLQPLITGPEGKNLIQTCLNVPDDPTPDAQGKVVQSTSNNEGPNGNPDFKVHPYLHKKDASPEEDEEDSSDQLFKRHTKPDTKLPHPDDLAIPNYLPMGPLGSMGPMGPIGSLGSMGPLGSMGGGMGGPMGGGGMGGPMGGGPMGSGGMGGGPMGGGGMGGPMMGGGMGSGSMGGGVNSMGGAPMGSSLPYPSLPHMYSHRQMSSVPYGSHMPPHMPSHFYQQETQPRFPAMLPNMPGMIPPPMSGMGLPQGMYSEQSLDGQDRDDHDDEQDDDDQDDDDEY